MREILPFLNLILICKEGRNHPHTHKHIWHLLTTYLNIFPQSCNHITFWFTASSQCPTNNELCWISVLNPSVFVEQVPYRRCTFCTSSRCTFSGTAPVPCYCTTSVKCIRYWNISKYEIYQSAMDVVCFFVSCMGCFTYHSLHFPLQSCWENNVPSHQSSEAEFPSCSSLDSQPSISLASAWWATARGKFLSSSLSSISLCSRSIRTDGALASAVSQEPTNR